MRRLASSSILRKLTCTVAKSAANRFKECFNFRVTCLERFLSPSFLTSNTVEVRLSAASDYKKLLISSPNRPWSNSISNASLGNESPKSDIIFDFWSVNEHCRLLWRTSFRCLCHCLRNVWNHEGAPILYGVLLAAQGCFGCHSSINFAAQIACMLLPSCRIVYCLSLYLELASSTMLRNVLSGMCWATA